MDGTVSLAGADDSGPFGTAFGVVMGALVGVLAGPAAAAAGAAVAGSAAAASIAASGMAVGSVTGGLVGLYRDLWVSGIDAGVVEAVSLELKPGTSCVVAAVDEAWTTPINVRMKELGGKVYRKLRIDVVDYQIFAETSQLDRELDELDAELEGASDQFMDDLTDRIAETRAEIEETGKKINTHMVDLVAEYRERVNALDSQIETSADQLRSKDQERKAALTADTHSRKEKPGKAASLAAQALSSQERLTPSSAGKSLSW